MATTVPSGATISLIVPETGEGSSTLTLSVLTSTMGSYFSTRSPGCLSQRSMVPSVTVSPTWGMVKSIAIRRLRLSVNRYACRSLQASA